MKDLNEFKNFRIYKDSYGNPQVAQACYESPEQNYPLAN